MLPFLHTIRPPTSESLKPSTLLCPQQKSGACGEGGGSCWEASSLSSDGEDRFLQGYWEGHEQGEECL